MKKWINGEFVDMTPEEIAAFSMAAAEEAPREPELAELLEGLSDAEIIAILKEALK